ncbi:hypothetical protein Aperf_G00000036636 [Anoplocephala perfoliata]
MISNCEEFVDCIESIYKFMPKDPHKIGNEPLKHVEKWTYAAEYHGEANASLGTALDVTEENLDKIRFKCKNLQLECEALSEKVKEAEQRQRKIAMDSSKQDVETKKMLSRLKAQLEMYKTVLQVGIEDFCEGRLRGIIFNPDGIAHCDLDREDKGDEDKQSTLDSKRRYAELNSVYSQLEISDQWKQFL